MRIDRALANLTEGAMMYLPLALLAVSLDISNGWTRGTALLTILSRLIYVFVFYRGIPVVRTFVWAPSVIAVPPMATDIVIGPP